MNDEINENKRILKDNIKCVISGKLSLITLIWTLISQNQRVISTMRKIGCPSLMSLITRMNNLKKCLDLDKMNDIRILLNSLLDRCKFVNKLLIGVS